MLANQAALSILLLKSVLARDEAGALWFVAGMRPGGILDGLIIFDVFDMNKVEVRLVEVAITNIEEAVVKLADARSYWHLEAVYMHDLGVKMA